MEISEKDKAMMQLLGIFPRRVELVWMDPHKGRESDDSPPDYYPVMIVPHNHVKQLFYLVPEETFAKLFELWKQNEVRKFGTQNNRQVS